MLKSKFWILPDSSVISVGYNEHADYAKAAMLGIRVDEAAALRLLGRNLFEPLTPEQVAYFNSRGADPVALVWVAQGKDARTFAVKNWGWIRVHDSAFNLWVWNDAALNQIRGARDYWQAQYALNEYDVLDIDEMSTNEKFTVKAKFAKRLDTTAEGLRYQGTVGAGRWRNPPDWEAVQWGPYRVELPKQAGVTGRITDEYGRIIDTFKVSADGVVVFETQICPPELAVKISNVYLPV